MFLSLKQDLINEKKVNVKTTCMLRELQEEISGISPDCVKKISDFSRDSQVIANYATEEVNKKNTLINLK
jgi:hypothetical protein